MPVLPDVEVFRRYIDVTALHKPIRGVEVFDADYVTDSSVSSLKRCLTGAAFDSTRRHGKHLGIALDSGHWLLLHFGMTGYPNYARIDRDPPRHSRLVVRFRNGFRLAYVNQRKLGRIRLAGDFNAFVAEWSLGPDALEIDRADFTELLLTGRGTIKARLMNQSQIAGLGNVYKDEILFQAGIHPAAQAKDVPAESVSDLWRTMRRVLRTAIDRRVQADQFPDSWLTPHREGEQCPRCRATLERDTISGRASRFCPACQPA
jgi:formamidopyrimidine-DNA glycosylase